MKPGNPVFSSLGTTIFSVMSALAEEHGAVNLGQGAPDGGGPDDVRQVAAQRVIDGPHQYPPFRGIPELRAAVAAHDRRFYGLPVSPDNVLVTSGATEALMAAFLALLSPGDEAIVIDPSYDSYRPAIAAAHASVRAIRLAPPDWRLSREALAAAFSPKTKLIVINTPMNPTGKVFSDDELSLVAEFAARFDAYVICDEVYEHLVLDGRRHRPLMTFDGMAARAIRIGSAGKTFSLTGWKVGYLTASTELIGLIAKAHQFLTFTTPPSLQHAVAYGLAKDDSYYHGLAADMESRRDHLTAELAAIGFAVLPCQGTYFLIADYAPLGLHGAADIIAKRLTIDAGVATIPMTAFYAEPPADLSLLRFCFAKSEAALSEAGRRLRRYFVNRPAGKRAALDAAEAAT
ncbi:MAG: aminotransferase [Proteobacteria bacterium]|nr:MAG: aminotransferase [Pseudomonadota bacterium]